MDSDHIVLLCTVPNRDAALKVANGLVERRLAACVNLLPGVTSVYRWQGKVQSDDELLLLIKSRAERYPEVEAAILQLHPYELPEIIALPIAHGLAGYLGWIDENVA